MAALFVGNPPAMQVLATLGVGALFVVAGCLLSGFCGDRPRVAAEKSDVFVRLLSGYC